MAFVCHNAVTNIIRPMTQTSGHKLCYCRRKPFQASVTFSIRKTIQVINLNMQQDHIISIISRVNQWHDPTIKKKVLC